VSAGLVLRRLERYRWFAFAVGTPIAVGLALVPLRDHIVNANVALILMAVVVITGVWAGERPAAFAAVSAALSFDFFHTVPYWQFRIDARDDIETTVLLLIVGFVVGRVAAHGWWAGQIADRRVEGILRLYRVGHLNARGDSAADVIMAAQVELIDLLDLRDCQFEAPPFTTPLERLDRQGLVGWGTRAGRLELPLDGVELLVLGRGEVLGRFVLHPNASSGPSLDQRIVAVAVADHVGAALAASPGATNDRVSG
jgi:hypothetical protein